ncbi:molybdopterin-dependent oxidoreductase [Pokkaliibacter sp. MBI-7]|uniref:molybdopterin-dependent oxidoreductase n=1 Tax=Pokkaliibacter sp. MBI-7 TaxID=3040600 RepID=UPI00244C2D62|nr:molybdopterin-dependent oxidoreductase [Pokkaliibacter sp. MBI-7]MDH2432479.1 molybdopterin-dependent oxidoreductase [Pokkaliibacter sp. MBI-7]
MVSQAVTRPLLRVVATVLVAFSAAFGLSGAQASDAPYPADRPVLTITAAHHEQVVLTLQQLEAMPSKTIGAFFPNLNDSDHSSQWRGIPLSEVLKLVDEKDKGVNIFALNNYSHPIPADDITQYDPIVAYQRDGNYMAVRNYGPLIVIYPLDDKPNLRNQDIYARMVWQVEKIDVDAE